MFAALGCEAPDHSALDEVIHSVIGPASRCPGSANVPSGSRAGPPVPARWVEARKPWVWRSPSRSGGIGQVNSDRRCNFPRCTHSSEGEVAGIAAGRARCGSLHRVCGDGSGDVFCMHRPFILCRRNTMMNFPLFLLTIYLGTSPVFAQETQTDSTRSERPTFSMTPT